MPSTQIFTFLFIVAIFGFIIFMLSKSVQKYEGWDATGWYFNRPSEWFRVQKYNLSDWITPSYNEAIQPDCLPYSKASKYGSLDDINYNSSAYKFWRF